MKRSRSILLLVGVSLQLTVAAASADNVNLSAGQDLNALIPNSDFTMNSPPMNGVLCQGTGRTYDGCSVGALIQFAVLTSGGDETENNALLSQCLNIQSAARSSAYMELTGDYQLLDGNQIFSVQTAQFD